MVDVILSQEDYDKLKAVADAARAVYAAAPVVQMSGLVLLRGHLAMATLGTALERAGDIQTREVVNADSKRTRNPKRR